MSYLDIPPREILEELEKFRASIITITHVDRSIIMEGDAVLRVSIEIEMDYGTIYIFIIDLNEEFAAIEPGKPVGFEEGPSNTIYFAKDGSCSAVGKGGSTFLRLRPPLSLWLLKKLKGCC